MLSWKTTRHAWPVIIFFAIREIAIVDLPSLTSRKGSTSAARNNNSDKPNISASQKENGEKLAKAHTTILKKEDVGDAKASNKENSKDHMQTIEGRPPDMHDTWKAMGSSGGDKNKSSSNEKEGKTKPLLVFHIGPHKTGTSTIQIQLQRLRNTIFKSHNIVYLGRNYSRPNKPEQNETLPSFLKPGTMRRLAEHCLRQHSQSYPCNEQADWKSFFEYIQAFEPWMQNRNTTFLLSEENFGLGHVDTMPLFAAQLQEWFRVRLVLTYRHFFEWVPSWYFENYKYVSMGVIPTFVDYWRQYGSQQTNNAYELPAWKQKVHPVTYLYNGWKPLVDEIVIFDMHNQSHGSEGLLTSFLETALPELSFDENWAKDDQKLPVTANQGWSLDFLVLAFAAAKQGLLNVTLVQTPIRSGSPQARIQRNVIMLAAKKIKNHLKALKIQANNIPQVCLNETELQEFFEISQILGGTVPGSDTFMDHNHSVLRFQKAVDKHKFCNVDSHKMLQNEKLRSFIQSL